MFDQQPHPADSLPRVFIVGCQKSGTSWMQALLDAHPQVCCRGEACFGTFLAGPVSQALGQYNQMQRAGEINRFSNDDAARVIAHAVRLLQRRWLDACPEPGAVRVIAEKTPEHAITLEVLSALFPSMRVIHIIRDGRDGVVSGWHHNLRDNAAAFRQRFPTMPAYARYFVEHHWIPYITRARAWGAANPARYHELRYERALEDPAGRARAIFEFLGVGTGDEAVERAVERASFKSMSGGRSHGQTDNASHMRRGVAGGWRQELDEQSLLAFEDLGAGMLRELGYPLSTQAVA